MNHNEIDQYLKELTNVNNCFDIVRGEVGDNTIVYYVSSLVDLKLIQQVYQLMENCNETYFGNIQKSTSIDEIITSILSGLLFVLPKDDNKDYYLIETRNYPTRGISEPATEQTIKGSKDGFCESIITNVGLIRRRIRSPSLLFEKYQFGISSKTDVILTYLKDRVDNDYLSKIKNNLINNIDSVDSIVMGDKAIEEILFEQKYNLFPLVKYSERPDIVCTQILKGKIALIIDNSSCVIITPTNAFEQIKHIEEYQHNPIVGSFLRCIRFIAILFSLFFVPLWLSLIKDNDFQSIFIYPESMTFKSIFWQVIVVELMIEILRIATIHTPSKLSSTMGLVSALILGQFAVEIGVFSKEILLYCSLSAIGGFATPSYELSLANKITKIFLLIFVGILGKIGLLISIFIIFLYLVNLNSKITPYLYPFVPFELNEFMQIFSRLGKEQKKRVR